MLPCSLLRRTPHIARWLPASSQQQVRPPSAASAYSTSGPRRHGSASAAASGDALAPANVLSQENRTECLRRLSRMPSLRPPSSGAESKKEAAVLVPLCLVNGELCLLFTLRSPHMSSHRGQVSFPGGMNDDGDDSPEATAVRETEEELGIPKERIQVWGRCPASESANRVSVVPVIGYLGDVDVAQIRFNPKEVGEVFAVPLQHLSDSRNFRYTQFRTGKGYVIPVFLGGKYRVWGLTAGVTHIFLSALLPTVYKNRVRFIKPFPI